MLPIIEIVVLATGAAGAVGGTGIAVARRNRVPRAPRLPSPYVMNALVAKLPPRHRREARAIIAIARDHDKRHGRLQLDAFTARETLRSYLPETINAYLLVPTALRGRARNGLRSPDDELAHQLFALRTGLERMRDADADIAVQRMRENETFLHDRFGEPPPATQAPRGLPEILDRLNERLTAFIRGA